VTARRRSPVSYEQWSVQFDVHVASTARESGKEFSRRFKRLAKDWQVRAYVALYCAGVAPGQEELRKCLFGQQPSELLKLSRDVVTIANAIERVNGHPIANPLAFLDNCREMLPADLRPADSNLVKLPEILRQYAHALGGLIKLLKPVIKRSLPDRKLSRSRLLAGLCALVEARNGSADLALVQTLLEAGQARGGTEASTLERRLRRYKSEHQDEWKWIQLHAAPRQVLDPMTLLGKTTLHLWPVHPGRINPPN
jgi:hypothetical protein